MLLNTQRWWWRYKKSLIIPQKVYPDTGNRNNTSNIDIRPDKGNTHNRTITRHNRMNNHGLKGDETDSKWTESVTVIVFSHLFVHLIYLFFHEHLFGKSVGHYSAINPYMKITTLTWRYFMLLVWDPIIMSRFILLQLADCMLSLTNHYCQPNCTVPLTIILISLDWP